MMYELIHACAVCFGEASGPQARGNTLGIITLALITAGVLSLFGLFFIRLAMRSSSKHREAISRSGEA